MLFIQIDMPGDGPEIVILATGEPIDGIRLVEDVCPGRTHGTEADEYLSYWNDDHCYYAGPEFRKDDVRAVAAERDPGFRELPWEEALAEVRRLVGHLPPDLWAVAARDAG